MRIKTVTIHHYRSIRALTLRCSPTTVLLGPNNHGKSNVLSALDFFFSGGKPEPADFFHHRGEDPELWVDITFSGLTEQERTTFAKYVDTAGEIRLRKCARLDPESSKVEVEYHGWLSQPKIEWLRSSFRCPKRDALPPELAPYCSGTGRLVPAEFQAAQQAYLAANAGDVELDYMLETDPLLGQKTVATGVLPDVYFIPAVRDLTQETAVKSTTVFGRLLTRAIGEMARSDEDFGRLKRELASLMERLNRGKDNDPRPEQLRTLEKRILDELRGWDDVQINIRVDAPDIEKVFELGTALYVNDGVQTLAEGKGHGLQRALIFAFTRAWAQALRAGVGQPQEATAPRAPSGSVLLLVEEPELYLHPHAQRRLNANLRAIGDTDHHQVFLTTHSPHFVDMEHHRGIAIVRKKSHMDGSQVCQCDRELFAGEGSADRQKRFNLAQWIGPERAEMFFAKRAVFVEGPTEHAAIPFLADRVGCRDPEVSIVDCGGKHNLMLYMEIAAAFGIEHVVIHDEDEGGGNAALNAKIQELAIRTGSIVEVLRPKFEDCAGMSTTGRRKPLEAIEYLERLTADGIPQRLFELVRAAYGAATSTGPEETQRA